MFFACQFCGVGKRSIDMVDVKRGIARRNLIFGGALGKTVEDYGDGNSVPVAELPAADLWINY